MATEIKVDNIIVRPMRASTMEDSMGSSADEGPLDEIVIEDPATGECLFHLEKMDYHYFWMRAYGVTRDLVAHIGVKIGEYKDHKIENGKDAGYEIKTGPICWGRFEWENACSDEDRPEKYRTPAAERRGDVSRMLKKYGPKFLLQELTGLLSEGDVPKREELVAALQNAVGIIGD